MKKFILDNFEEGLLLCGRNNKSIEAKLIRMGVHSVTNHNGITAIIDDVPGILEAVSPISKFTPYTEYEDLMNKEDYIVELYRHTDLGMMDHIKVARYFQNNLLGKPYPKKYKMVLLAMPLYNAIIDHTNLLPSLRLTWCSQLCMDAFLSVDSYCLDGVNGKKKELFTPATFEHRIVLGKFINCTREKIIKL